MLNRKPVIHGMQENLDSVFHRRRSNVHAVPDSRAKKQPCTTEQYVRAIPNRKDGSRHEVITSVRHRETWAHGKDGWVAKGVQEIEHGPTYLDGEFYDLR